MQHSKSCRQAIGYSIEMALYSSCQSVQHSLSCFLSLMKQEAKVNKNGDWEERGVGVASLAIQFEGLGSGWQL